MITLKSAHKVQYGHTLTQEDVDHVNSFECSIDKKWEYIKSHAKQYHFDGIAEGKQADYEHHNAYGE